MSGKKLTEAEKVRRAARKMEKKQAAELGPLFAGQVEPIEERALMYQRRRGTAGIVEHHQALMDSMYVLDPLLTANLKRRAAEHLPAELVERLDEHCRRTYRCVTYHAGFWRDVLCGKRIVFGWKRVDDPTSSIGFRAVPDGVFPPEGWVPPWTEEQAKYHFWSNCRACGMWHAPGQVECYEGGSRE